MTVGFALHRRGWIITVTPLEQNVVSRWYEVKIKARTKEKPCGNVGPFGYKNNKMLDKLYESTQSPTLEFL